MNNSLNALDIPTDIYYDHFRTNNQKIKLKIKVDKKYDKGSFDLDLDMPFTFKKANRLGAPMFFSPSLPHLQTDVVETSMGKYLLKSLDVGKHNYTFMGFVEDYDNWAGNLEVEVTKISIPPSSIPKKPPITINPKTSAVFPIQNTIILLISIVLYFSCEIYKYKNYLLNK